MRMGGCQCGELRYEIAAEPLALYVCHCRECRKQSASAFGLSLRVPSSGFRVTQGLARFWSRVTDRSMNRSTSQVRSTHMGLAQNTGRHDSGRSKTV
jgi:hypothetical protein